MLKRSIIILAAVVASMLVLQPAAQAAGFAEFTDIGGHWAVDAISQLHAMDIVKGDPDGRVRPDDPITRGEFVALLLRVEDIKASARTESPFVDVPGNHWAFGLIQAAKENGIVNGVDATHFGLTDNVTREQAVAMIMRAGKAVELSLTGQTFADVEAGRWSVEAIQSASRAGILDTTATALNAFRPAAPATRAEVMSMLANLLDAETKADMLPSDDQLLSVIQNTELTTVEIINKGYPFDWTSVSSQSVGAYAELQKMAQSLYDLGGQTGGKWNFVAPTFANAKVVHKTQHMAVVEMDEHIQFSVTGPNGTTNSDLTQTQRFYLRLVGGSWRIFAAEPVVR